jgi:tetratricopeptide (TPR) repeat protein
MYAGRIPEATALTCRYAERQPLDGWTFGLHVYLAWFDGHYERGLEATRKALAAHPDAPNWMFHMAWSLAWAGQIQEAIALVDKLDAMAPGRVHTKLSLMLRHGLRGEAATARAELTPEFVEWCRRAPLWSYMVGTSFSLAGAAEDALEWLTHAVDLGWINYPLLAAKDPLLVNLRGDPRFEQLMARVKHEWEAFEV